MTSDYTAAFYYRSTPIPTLSQWGMIVLSVLLGFSAIWIIRKRKAALVVLIVLGMVLSITGHAWAPPPPLIMLDGEITDWESARVSPSVMDPMDDSSINDPGEDIVAGYITSDINNIYFSGLILLGVIIPLLCVLNLCSFCMATMRWE